MAGIVRLGDKNLETETCPSVSCITASINVFVNSRGVHRLGDLWPLPSLATPLVTTTSGSSKVFVNNKPVARQNDSLSCGSICLECSDNVISG